MLKYQTLQCNPPLKITPPPSSPKHILRYEMGEKEREREGGGGREGKKKLDSSQ